jgi:hypothetical protein
MPKPPRIKKSRTSAGEGSPFPLIKQLRPCGDEPRADNHSSVTITLDVCSHISQSLQEQAA